MKIDYEIIDNFLPQQKFLEIQKSIMNVDFAAELWSYNDIIASEDESKNWKYFYLTHLIYCNSTEYMELNNDVVSRYMYEKIIPVLEKLDIRKLIRVKANLYPNSEELHEHEFHTDFEYSHMAAILYINTCNGYTKFENGTKVDSIANRVLLFDGNVPHCSTTTTDQTARFNIGFNWRMN